MNTWVDVIYEFEYLACEYVLSIPERIGVGNLYVGTYIIY
jgi:hypothetical protein